MLQLAHIARPSVLHEFLFGRSSKHKRSHTVFARIYIQKMLCQQDDILAALSQGRKMKLNRVETIEEVLTKLTLTDFFTLVGIGGSKYAHIHVVQHV